MRVLRTLRYGLQTFVSGLLGFDEFKQSNYVFDFFTYDTPQYFGPNGDYSQFADYLIQKYFLRSLHILDKEGNVIASSCVDGKQDPTIFHSVFDRIGDKLPESDVIYIHSTRWYAVYSYKDLIFAVSSEDVFTVAEMRALAQDMLDFMNGG